MKSYLTTLDRMIVQIHTKMSDSARSCLHLATQIGPDLALTMQVIRVDLLLVIHNTLDRHMQLNLTGCHSLLLLNLLLHLSEMVYLSLLDLLLLLDSHLLCLLLVLFQHLLLEFFMLPLLMLSFPPRFQL